MPQRNCRPDSALRLCKELPTESATSAGGFNFFQQAFGHSLKSNSIRIHLATYRGGRLLLKEVK